MRGDITTDQPNVWFELGLAFGSGKDVVLVCANNRESRIPFDVQHRPIVGYATESPRDFCELQQRITQRLSTIQHKSSSIANAATVSPLAPVEGLSQHEIVTLIAIGENIDHPSERVSAQMIRQDMERAGFTTIATTLALAKLLQMKFISIDSDAEINDEGYASYRLMPTGMQWLMDHLETLILKRAQEPAHS